MSIYEYRNGDAEKFASDVGIKTRNKGEELEFGFCPYCRGGSHNDKFTFSINRRTGQFECKRASCGAKGNMITLAKDFSDRFVLSNEVSAYFNISNYNNKFKSFKDSHRITESSDRAVDYLKSRGISEAVAKKYEVTTKSNDDRIMVFPFKDENGNLTFIKYRNLEYQNGKGSKEFTEPKCKPILFGMNHCNFNDCSTLVITEGQIDSLSLAEAGVKNAVSVPLGKNGFTWRPHCWNWMLKFDEIVVFGDCENGNVTLAEQIVAFFPKKVRIVRVEDYLGFKDANEILMNKGKQALINAVEKAEVNVSLRIKNLSEVNGVDYSKMKSYKTYFEQLDATIGGGFHEGELIILTGKCGEGKSTFASMILGRMIQQGLTCFAYSGELPAANFKAWLDFQIIGTIKPELFEINQSTKWYDKRCYIYDDSSVIDEHEELFGILEQAIKHLDCKFILIDNLMTAMEDKQGEDLFRQQSRFVTKLTKVAKSYNVIIMLIAHPKKGDSDENDSISGSGDITNRANLVLRFQRKSRDKVDENKSLLKITKNRTTGKLNFDGIEMLYDPDSMRIIQSNRAGFKFDEFMISENQQQQIKIVENDDSELYAEIPF